LRGSRSRRWPGWRARAGEGTAGSVQGGGEGEAAGVGSGGGVADEGADGLVSDEEGPGFLAGEAGGAGAQDAAAGEVGLGLAVGGLGSPAAGVGGGEVRSGVAAPVRQVVTARYRSVRVLPSSLARGMRNSMTRTVTSPGSGPCSWGRREPRLRRLALRMFRRCASRVPLTTDSQDPSGSGWRTGRRMPDLTRHSRRARVAAQACRRARDQKPRPASSSMPGCRHLVRAAASFCSPSARGPMAARAGHGRRRRSGRRPASAGSAPLRAAPSRPSRSSRRREPSSRHRGGAGRARRCSPEWPGP
jgi:hypothetical protein